MYEAFANKDERSDGCAAAGANGRSAIWPPIALGRYELRPERCSSENPVVANQSRLGGHRGVNIA